MCMCVCVHVRNICQVFIAEKSSARCPTLVCLLWLYELEAISTLRTKRSLNHTFTVLRKARAIKFSMQHPRNLCTKIMWCF